MTVGPLEVPVPHIPRQLDGMGMSSSDSNESHETRSRVCAVGELEKWRCDMKRAETAGKVPMRRCRCQSKPGQLALSTWAQIASCLIRSVAFSCSVPQTSVSRQLKQARVSDDSTAHSRHRRPRESQATPCQDRQAHTTAAGLRETAVWLPVLEPTTISALLPV